jgi:hypothetical protein
MVVVVTDPRLVAHYGAHRLETPHQTRSSQRAQHVVDRLVGDLAEVLTHDTDDRIRVGVRMVVHRAQHRYPRTRHTQSSPAQHALEVRSCWHAPKLAPFLESIKSRRRTRLQQNNNSAARHPRALRARPLTDEDRAGPASLGKSGPRTVEGLTVTRCVPNEQVAVDR